MRNVKSASGTPSRTSRSPTNADGPFRSNDGAVNRPAIRKKRPSPNSQPVPSRIVMPAVTASGISS